MAGIVRKELCVYAGPPRKGARSEPGRGVPRTCGHPTVGGTVHHLAECQSCTHYSTAPVPGDGAAPASLPLDVLPCVYRGADTGTRVECATCTGKVELKVLACAVHPEGCTVAKPVEGRACCAGCTERVAPAHAPPAGPKLVTIPPLAPLLLPAPRSTRAVVTVVTGSGAEALHAITRPYHEEYARRLGADYVVLRDPPPAPEFPLSAKFRLGQTLDYYDRAVYLDADALPLPDCPDLFEMVREDEFGFHDDMPGLKRTGGFDHLIKEYHELRGVVGLHAARCEHILNTGVMVFSRGHRTLLDPPVGRIPHRHLAEQSWYTARLHDLAPRVKLLPPAGNYQYWEWDKFRALKPTDAVIAHWSGLIPHQPPEKRLELMRAFVAKVAAAHPPWEPPAELYPASHLASADLRHVRWMRDTLASGRFRRVLEIGCCDGFSTAAFLDACARGWVDHVDLCEPFVRPGLESVISHYGLGDRVTLHRERSEELLARGGKWDLVFVDGDHEQPTVDAETRLLLAAGVPALFVHDTNASGMWPAPARMKGAFQAAGYRGIEDMTPRAGERTDRGMFLAARDESAYDASLAAYRKWCAPNAVKGC